MYLDEAVISIQKVLPITTLDHETTELFQQWPLHLNSRRSLTRRSGRNQNGYGRDNESPHREASVGASKLLGRPREKFGVLRESGGMVTTADTHLGPHRTTLNAMACESSASLATISSYRMIVTASRSCG